MSDDDKKYCALVKVAKESITAHLKGEEYTPPEAAPPLDEAKGVFVTLYKPGKELRGCIGHLEAQHENVVQEIADVAVSSAVRDTRFPPLQESELSDLDIEISLLFPEEPVSDMKELDPKRYGVIVSCGLRRGVLLPDLDGVDTVEYQVSIAMQKGGISPSDDFSLTRFKVTKVTKDGVK